MQRPPPKPAVRNLDARNLLVMKYERLPYYVAGRMWKSKLIRNLGYDDAVQIGYIKLIRAAELWEEGRGVEFMTYAYRSIQLGIYCAALRSIKPSDPMTNHKSLEEWGGVLADAVKEDPIVCREVKEAWKKLPKRSRYVVWRVVVDRVSYQEVAGVIHTTKERVRQLLNDALKWMASYVNGEKPERLHYLKSHNRPKIVQEKTHAI